MNEKQKGVDARPRVVRIKLCQVLSRTHPTHHGYEREKSPQPFGTQSSLQGRNPKVQVLNSRA